MWTPHASHWTQTKKKKDCLLLFPQASYLQELLQPWMFLCLCVPRRLRLPCEEPGSVHGSPLAAVLHCVVEAASLNRVYLREGGRREWEERCSWQQQHFDSQLKSVVCHCQVEQPGVAPRLAFVLSATLIWYFFRRRNGWFVSSLLWFSGCFSCRVLPLCKCTIHVWYSRCWVNVQTQGACVWMWCEQLRCFCDTKTVLKRFLLECEETSRSSRVLEEQIF